MSNLEKAKRAKEDRAAAVVIMQDLAKANDGDFSTDDQAKWDAAHADEKRHKALAERFEGLAAFDREEESRKTALKDEGIDVDQQAEQRAKIAKEYSARFNRVVRAASSGTLSPADMKFLTEHRGTATQVTNVDGLGGFLIPTEFSGELEKHRKMYGGMKAIARTIQTSTGAPLNFPTVNDTNNKGNIHAEGQTVAVKDVAFGNKQLTAFVFDSGIMLLSWELIQDSAFNLQAELSTLGGERIGRKENEMFTLGTGVAQPEGVLTGGSLGFTAAAAALITTDDITELIHSVDPAYRNGASTRLMFNDDTLKVLKTLKDAEGRPLWQPSVIVGEPDKFGGQSYIINQDMPNIASGATPIVFGDFQKLLVREVKGTSLMVFREKYADKLVNGYMLYSRADSKVINADALKWLAMA